MLDVTSHHRPDLDSLVTELKDELKQDYAPPHVKRHAHPKMHGCVQAILRIDAQVPDELRHGVFAEPGREYRAWVRFSNALGIEHDLKFINRGMAIKLLDVKGERLLPHDLPFMLETGTQDFVLATGDAFVLPTAANYAEVATAARAGFPSLVMALVKRKLWRGLAALFRGGTVLAPSPLAIPYFSQTPYTLGPEQVVKLHARPCRTRALVQSLPGTFQFGLKTVLANLFLGLAGATKVKGVLKFFGFAGTMEEAEAFCERYLAPRNWLRLAMAAFLSHSPAQFELMVQTRTDPASMPIDDATVRWSERRSPFRRVAMLTIPRQVFWPAAGMPPAILKATSAMMELGENMSFMPWHGLTDHEPLGDINDARRRIYADMSTYRRGQNQVTPPDPAADYNSLRRVVQDGLL
jgi:hypothetical protein